MVLIFLFPRLTRNLFLQVSTKIWRWLFKWFGCFLKFWRKNWLFVNVFDIFWSSPFVCQQIKTNRVCPFQNLSTFDDLMCTFFKELKLTLWIVFNLMEQIYVLCVIWKRFYNHYSWFFVLHESFKDSLIQRKNFFIFFSQSFCCLKVFICFLLFIVFVACHAVSMTFLKAKPAEIILARSTNHTLTPLIFLDLCLAFWTLFRIRFNPS